ncbi:MAG: penicillin-binding transpeptidase domain-containing protein [Actinomycetota bacterium]|nr:penicillin-binding transpeptidase domain-containing protein [Actinomycetota bacterium]
MSVASPRQLASEFAARLPRRLPVRAIAAGAGLLVALLAGVLLLTGGRPAEELVAERFVAAWERDDFAAMHAELSSDSRRATPLTEFTADYRRSAATATALSVKAGEVGELRDGIVAVPVTVRTRLVGAVRATLSVPFDGTGDEARIDWARNLTFPGVRRGDRLERRTRLPPRADILARDGRTLAEGPERRSPLGPAATSIVGRIEDPPKEDRQRLRELGYPSGSRVGVSGLERVFEERLAGRPGGVLRAGGTLFGTSEPETAQAVRTTIDPDVQRAATEVLGERVGGIAVMRPRNGEILALSGIAFSGLSPPGSTFKIVTLAGVLEAGLAGPKSKYPVQTTTQLEGVNVENANGESCGGTLRDSFAHSCNSVFAPLGATLGAERLVRAAEAFGFNEDLGIPGAVTSTLPPADEIGDDLAVGSSAIGQGKVQSTALQMALVASTIAGRGRRPKLTLERGRPPVRKRAIATRTARIVARYMEAVVREGTGRAAAINRVRVAGKTGTAELRSTATPNCLPTAGAPCPPPAANDPTDTDAWFAAFAPANSPRVAVGVLLVASGAGGESAAPVAREVLLAGLRATR